MDGKVIIGTSLDTSGLDKGLSNMSNSLEKKAAKAAENAAIKSSKKFNAAFVLGVSALSSVIGKIITSITNTIGDSISRVDTLENFPKVMSNLGIDSKEAAVSVQYLSEKLTGLPTTLDDAVSSVQRLTSANNNVMASTEMFLALNNAILAGGASTEIQRAALEQLSQSYAKGKPDMLEWRTAMVAMPAQLKQVAVAMGYISADKLGEALRNGEVSMNDFMRTLVKMNKEGINGYASLEEQARTGTQGIRTSLVNLKTTIVRAGAEILQIIGQKNIANFFNVIINAIKATIPYISAFVKSFVSAVNVIFSIASKLIKAIGNIFGLKGKKNTKETTDGISSAGTAMSGLVDNTNAATNSVKKLNKELDGTQSFDEMNILQEPSGSSSGDTDTSDLGGLGDLGNIESPLDGLNSKIAELIPSTKLFTAAVWGLIGAWATFNGLKLLKNLGLLNLSIRDILRIASGIGLIIGGVVLIVQGVIAYMNDPTWSNFALILGGIALAAAGVALAFGAIPAAIVAVILLIAAIALAVYKNWDKIKAVLEPIGKWVNEKIIQPIVGFFVQLWNKIKEIFTPVIEFFKNIFETTFENVRIYIDNLKQIFKALWDGIKAIFEPVGDFFKGIFEGAMKKIKEAFAPIVNFFNEIWNKIKNSLRAFGAKVGEVIGGAFKTVINGVLARIENVLNFPVKAINKLINTVNKLPGVELTKFKTYRLPRLAKGGIINQPGRGIPVGSAIGGEKGREGVIPLTDSQQMQLLGQSIGKYVSINLTNITKLDNRQIAKEQRKINAQNDFAFNR